MVATKARKSFQKQAKKKKEKKLIKVVVDSKSFNKVERAFLPVVVISVLQQHPSVA